MDHYGIYEWSFESVMVLSLVTLRPADICSQMTSRILTHPLKDVAGLAGLEAVCLPVLSGGIS